MALTTTRSAARRLRLLYLGDAALARECLGRPGGSIEVVHAVPDASGTFNPVPPDAGPRGSLPFDILLIEHGHPGVETLAILRDLAARRLHVPVVIVAEWDEDLAVAALTLGASDYVVKSRPSFRAVYFRLHRLIAHAALLDERSRPRDNSAITVEVAREPSDREDLVRRVAEAESAREGAEQRLTEAVLRIKQARQDRLADAVAAAREYAQHEADFTARLRAAAVANGTLEERLAGREAALKEAEQQRLADAVAAERLAQREATLVSELRDAATTCERLERQLTNVQTALQCAEQRVMAEQQAGLQRSAEQHAEFHAELSRQAASRDALREQVAELKLALERAETARRSESAAVEARVAEQNTVYQARASESAAIQDALERQLASVEAALQAATERHASEIDEISGRLAESQDTAAARLAEAAVASRVLESTRTEAEAERQRAEQRRASEMAEAAERLADLQAESETSLLEAAAITDTLKVQLADAAATLERVEQQAAADRETATAHNLRRQAEFDAQLAEELARSQALAGQLRDGEAALQGARERHASELNGAAVRLADSQAKAETRLAQADAAMKVAESKRAEIVAAMSRVVKQATAERQAASEEIRQHQATFRTELTLELDRRQTAERELAESRAAFEKAERRFRDEVSADAQRAREHETGIEQRAADERAEWHRTGLAMEADITRLRAESASLQLALEETRAAGRDTLSRVSAEAALERARLESLVIDRDVLVQEQAERARAADEAAAARLADVEHRLELTVAARHRDGEAAAHLQNRLDAISGELHATKSQREALRATAERVPALEEQIEAIRADSRRQFDIPVSRCRCSRNGSITEVNQALARLLGYGTPEELLGIDFSDRVCESGDELQWLVDRCVGSRASESIDTTWKRKDGSRIIVRLLSRSTGADRIDLVVEDITRVRELEEKLRNAQRMEAVARYGSEVAVTCHTLLTHVKQEGQQWLARMDSDTGRYQGALLLDDVTRAAGFLGQLAAYGDEQNHVPDLVDVNKVLRDLEPVLKRVAGDDIEVVLPTGSGPLNLDVEARPVERMLVNVAAYGRERMPLGGRLMIDVASVVLDRDFVSKHPNVRPGPHVLLTVNEVRGAGRADALAAIRTRATTEHPGVDLGTLQALVRDCGGHLWMKAEPPGDMTLKIHLPRRILDRSEPRARAKRPGRSGWIHRAFGARH